MAFGTEEENNGGVAVAEAPVELVEKPRKPKNTEIKAPDILPNPELALATVYGFNAGAFMSITAYDPVLNRVQGGHLVTCRETFLDSYFRQKTAYFAFAHALGFSQNVANFITECENRLKALPAEAGIVFDNDTKVIPCASGTSSIIVPATWWRSAYIRRALFTILLRSGMSYNDNFETALYSDKYAKSTKLAIERFFQGYTLFNKPKNQGGGWVMHFEGADQNYVAKLLIRKIIKNSEKNDAVTVDNNQV